MKERGGEFTSEKSSSIAVFCDTVFCVQFDHIVYLICTVGQIRHMSTRNRVWDGETIIFHYLNGTDGFVSLEVGLQLCRLSIHRYWCLHRMDPI